MKRLKPLSIVVSWLVVTVVLMGAQLALAQAPTCRGPSCNGKDPGVTNCSADAQSPSDPNSTQAIYDQTGTFVGLVEVRYSPACQAAWARTRLFDGTAYCPGQLLAQIQRNGDSASFTKVDNVFARENGSCPLRSPMLYTPRPFLVTATGGSFNRFTASTPLVDPRQ